MHKLANGLEGRGLQSCPAGQSLEARPKPETQASADTVQEGGGTVLVGAGVQLPPEAIGTGIRIEAVPASQVAASLTRGTHVFGANVLCAQGKALLHTEPVLEMPA